MFTAALEFGWNRSLNKLIETPSTANNNQQGNETSKPTPEMNIKNEFYAKLGVDSKINDYLNIYADVIYNDPGSKNVVAIEQYKINEDTSLRVRVYILSKI